MAPKTLIPSRNVQMVPTIAAVLLWTIDYGPWIAVQAAASSSVRAAQDRHPNDPVVNYNAGTRSYRQRRYEAAADALNHALSAATLPLQGRVAYNLGNARYRLAQAKEQAAPAEAMTSYQQALENYKLAIQRHPRDLDAVYNYELTTRHLEQLKAQNAAQQQKQEKEKKSSQREGAGPSSEQDQQGQRAQGESQAPRTSGASDARQAEQHAAPKPESEIPKDTQQSTNASTGHDQQGTTRPLSEQDALRILETMKREERGSLSQSRQDRAHEPDVEHDW